MKQQLVTIIPPDPKDAGVSLSNGTRVILQNGTELGFVTSIELSAEPGDIWRATIHCLPHMSHRIHAMATIHTIKPLPWWRRWLLRVAGARVVDVSNLNSTAREYRLQ